MPEENVSLASSAASIFIMRSNLIDKLLAIPISSDGLEREKYVQARHLIADGCVGFLAAVHKATLPSTVELAQIRVDGTRKASSEAARAGGKKSEAARAREKKSADQTIIFKPLAFSGRNSFLEATADHPEVQEAFRQEFAAQDRLRFATEAQAEGLKLLPSLTQNVKLMLRKLYEPTPSDEQEVNELLRKHGMDEGPLASVLSKP